MKLIRLFNYILKSLNHFISIQQFHHFKSYIIKFNIILIHYQIIMLKFILLHFHQHTIYN